MATKGYEKDMNMKCIYKSIVKQEWGNLGKENFVCHLDSLYSHRVDLTASLGSSLQLRWDNLIFCLN